MKVNKFSVKVQSGKLTITPTGTPRYSPDHGGLRFNGTLISIDVKDPSIQRMLKTLISELGSIEVKVKILEKAMKGNTLIKLLTPNEEIIKQALKKLGLPREATKLLELMAKNGKILDRGTWEKFSSLKRQFPKLTEEIFMEALQKGIPLKKPLVESLYYMRHPAERWDMLTRRGVSKFADPGMFYESRLHRGDTSVKSSFKARFFTDSPLIDSYHLESMEGVKKVLVSSKGKTVESSFTEDTAYFEMELKNSGRCRVLITRSKIKIWFGSRVFEVWKNEIDGIDFKGRKVEVHLE